MALMAGKVMLDMAATDPAAHIILQRTRHVTHYTAGTFSTVTS